ncbi:MAG: glycosyltransferase [Cytophagales bacterium]|nr:glycosyltransferase [Cytophagales bacterium]
MKKILILYDYFDPAYKAGGPIRSLANLVRFMDDQLKLYMLTSNRDLDGAVLKVEPDCWIAYDAFSKIYYISNPRRGYGIIRKIMSDIDPDIVYINGMYSLHFVVFPLLVLRRKRHQKVVIAPRGMLQIQSLSIKPYKKKLYLTFLQAFVIPQNVHWHVTTEQEKDELLKFLQGRGRISLIGNIPSFNPGLTLATRAIKKKRVFGTVALVSPMKNIHLVLNALSGIKSELEYHLYGPIKDPSYWKECREIRKRMPSNIRVYHFGELLPDKVSEVISGFDFYIQPSKSENFGHSIFEAFNQGVPVIISDQTPWRDLKGKKAGWDVNLSVENSLATAINEALSMDCGSYMQLSCGARKMAEEYMKETDFSGMYKKLFTS